MTSKHKVGLKQMLQIVRVQANNHLPPKYKVLKVMGEGGFGKVLHCLDRETNNPVAIKVPLFDQNCRKEVAMLQKLMELKLDEHNIVKFHECFTVNKGTALVFESLEVNIFNYMCQNSLTPMTLTDTRTIFTQMATALTALKNIGVIHSDIKLDNVMLVDHQRPFRIKLIDFGLAIDKSKAKQGMTLQTVSFRAPEIILGQPFSEAIDMWSVGCMMFSMLFSYYLFEDEEYDTLNTMIEILGRVDEFLNTAKQRNVFFIYDKKANYWRIKTRKEYFGEDPPAAPDKHTFSSLDDLKKSSADYKAEAAEYEQCIELMKAMLTIDQNKRITPDEVLQHPFITQKKESIDPPKDQHSPPPTVFPSGVILVRPATPENTSKLEEEETSVSLNIEDIEHNEDTEDHKDNETPSTPDDSDSEDNETLSTPDDSDSEDNETPSTPDDSDSEDNETPSTPDDSDSEDNETPSTPDDSDSEDNETPSTPDDSDSEDNETPSTPDDSDSEDNETPSTPDHSDSEDNETPSTPDHSDSEDNETPSTPDHSDRREKKNVFQRMKSWFKRKFRSNRVGVM